MNLTVALVLLAGVLGPVQAPSVGRVPVERKAPEWHKPENRQKNCTGAKDCDCAYHRWLKRGGRVEPRDPDIPVIIPAG